MTTGSGADGPQARIEVAAGILRDDAGRVLIAERHGDTAFHGLWEFPGGKVDAGETPQQALHRELREELDIDVFGSRHWQTLEHDYPDRCVRLHFFLVDGWQRQPRGAAGQQLRWVSIDALDEQSLLPADAPIVTALRDL